MPENIIRLKNAMRWWPWLLIAVASTASAQLQPQAESSPSFRPFVAPRLSYVSPLKLYRPYADTAVGDWRQANDAVAHIGGWRAYAKERRADSEARSEAETEDTPTEAGRTSPSQPSVGGQTGAKP
jgi:hypothetical protein